MKFNENHNYAHTHSQTHRKTCMYQEQHSLWRMHTQIQMPWFCLVLLFHISKINSTQHVHCSHRIQTDTHIDTSYTYAHMHRHTHARIHSYQRALLHTMFYKFVNTYGIDVETETRRHRRESIELNSVVRRIYLTV